MAEQGTPSGNAGFSWSLFDSEAYFQHYYGDPHVDEAQVIRHACSALMAARPEGNGLETVDVGTGPNLIPMLCALPRASSMTGWEYSPGNIAWLERELATDAIRPQWRHFWNIAVETYGSGYDLPTNPIPELRQKVRMQRGSIYDLPERRWDAATMFFCAESITEKDSEFNAACVRFAKCVRPGGTLAAAFLAGSSGYDVAERRFPALRVSEADIREVFAPVSADQKTAQIGIVEEEVRSGYSGMVFLTAQAI